MLFNDTNAFNSKTPDTGQPTSFPQSKESFAFSDSARSQNWPVFWKGKQIVDHIHVMFTEALQATVEPVKAALTSLDFQTRVKKWQKELDQPIWQESQSSLQKFWSRSIDQSVQVFTQSIFQDMPIEPIFNSRLFVSSKNRNVHDVGQWQMSTCSFDVAKVAGQKMDDTTEAQSQLKMSIKVGATPFKHYNVEYVSLSSETSFYMRNVGKQIKPLEVKVKKNNGQGTKQFFLFPSPGHESCVQKLLQIWRLLESKTYRHDTNNTATMMKNAFAIIPRLYRSDPEKFGEVICLFQSLAHEDSNSGMRLVSDFFCNYEHPFLRKPNSNPLLLAKQFTGLRSLRLCLRNFSDQKETLCCVLVLLLKLLLWKKTSTEQLTFDETTGTTQVLLSSQLLFLNEA
jgi:hypothetical protein